MKNGGKSSLKETSFCEVQIHAQYDAKFNFLEE